MIIYGMYHIETDSLPQLPINKKSRLVLNLIADMMLTTPHLISDEDYLQT